MKFKRFIWTSLQIILMFTLFISINFVIDMSFAKPNGGFYNSSGEYIHCEAVSSASRYSAYPHCAWFGSKETNIRGYLLAWSSSAILGGLLWITCRRLKGMEKIGDQGIKIKKWRRPNRKKKSSFQK
jgi:hypothetical protein